MIGRGGASTVHRARYVATGAPVALTVLDVVHRDVEPASVVLRTVDPVLGDLGTAQLLDDVAAELLTGDPPFPRSTAFAVIHAHLTAPPPSLRRRRGWLPERPADRHAPAPRSPRR